MKLLFLGVADELPVVGERAAVEVAQVLEDDLRSFAEGSEHLEEINHGLVRQAIGKEFAERSSR